MAIVCIMICVPVTAECMPESASVARWFNRNAQYVVAAALSVMVADGDHSRTAAGSCVDGMIMSLAASELLKQVTAQPRPRDPGARDGFPSSHSAVGFAFARSISDWDRNAGLAAYAFAGTLGWARIESGHHTVEQVIAGAALGLWLAGASVEADGFLISAEEYAVEELGADQRGMSTFTTGSLSFPLLEVQW